MEKAQCSSQLVDRQWGNADERKKLSLPLSASILSITAMHIGSTKQVVTFDTAKNTWVNAGTEYWLYYIAICK